MEQESVFRFKQFDVRNGGVGLKVGTDGVLLGALSNIGHLPAYDSCSNYSCKEVSGILDIGTGTGLIALMLAQRCNARIWAIDIDSDAASLAACNFAHSPWAERLCCLHCALRDFKDEYSINVTDGQKMKWDLIVSNPPYFENSLKCPKANRSIARHNDSLSYREIAEFAAENLSGHGRLSLILPSEQERDVVRHCASFGLYPERMVQIYTTAKKPAKRTVMEFCRIKCETQRETLTMMENGSYTPEFKSLVYNFYEPH